MISRNPKTEDIETIRKRFQKKPIWLLIRVTKVNPRTATAQEGKLLAHSADRNEVLRASLQYKGSIMIDCSVKKLPHNYAAAF